MLSLKEHAHTHASTQTHTLKDTMTVMLLFIIATTKMFYNDAILKHNDAILKHAYAHTHMHTHNARACMTHTYSTVPYTHTH